MVHHDSTVQFDIVGDDGTTFPTRDDLIELKAKSADIANTAKMSAVVAAPCGLGNVFDDLQPTALRQPRNAIHISGRTAHMHRHDGFGVWGYFALDVSHVQRQRRVDFRNDWHCT
jgi:hypothetical protein